MDRNVTIDPKLACSDCKGTGRDEAKTKKAQDAGKIDSRAYVRCWTCNGNGLDPAKFFRWSNS